MLSGAPILYQKWFNTISKLTFFIISYLISGIIFKISFDKQITLVFRIILLIGLIQFYFQTVSKDQFYHFALSERKTIRKLATFLILMFQFIPLLMKSYKKAYQERKSIVGTIDFSIKKCINNQIFIPDIENYSRYSFYSFPNLILLFYLLLIILLVSI